MISDRPVAPPHTTTAPTLSASHLRKSYNGVPALRDLSFTLQAGRILGFLGPNGAGKTTAIRILTTILEPDSGQFTVDGVASDRPAQIRRKIGVLPESLGLPKQMTATEFLVYFGRHYGFAAAPARTRAAALLALILSAQLWLRRRQVTRGYAPAIEA